MKVTVTYKDGNITTTYKSIVKVLTRTITVLDEIASIPPLTYEAIILVFKDGCEIPLNPKYFDVTIEC